MTLAAAFWITYFIALIFGGWSNWPAAGGNFRPLGGTIMFFLLVGLLGWQVFKAPIHG